MTEQEPTPEKEPMNNKERALLIIKRQIFRAQRFNKRKEQKTFEEISKEMHQTRIDALNNPKNWDKSN